MAEETRSPPPFLTESLTATSQTTSSLTQPKAGIWTGGNYPSSPMRLEEPRIVLARQLRRFAEQRLENMVHMGRTVALSDRILNAVIGLTVFADSVTANAHHDFSRMERGYTEVLTLLDRGLLEQSLVQLFLLETDPKISEMLRHYEAADGFPKYAVEVAVILSAWYLAGAVVGVLGLTKGGASYLVGTSASAVFFQGLLGEAVTGEPRLYQESLTPEENTFRFLEQVMLTAGMLQWMGVAAGAYGTAIERTVSQEAISGWQRGVIAAGGGAVELGAMTAWAGTIQLYEMAKVGEMDPELWWHNTLSSAAFEERVIFWLAMKTVLGMGQNMGQGLTKDLKLEEWGPQPIPAGGPLEMTSYSPKPMMSSSRGYGPGGRRIVFENTPSPVFQFEPETLGRALQQAFREWRNTVQVNFRHSTSTYEVRFDPDKNVFTFNPTNRVPGQNGTMQLKVGEVFQLQGKFFVIGEAGWLRPMQGDPQGGGVLPTPAKEIFAKAKQDPSRNFGYEVPSERSAVYVKYDPAIGGFEVWGANYPRVRIQEGQAFRLGDRFYRLDVGDH